MTVVVRARSACWPTTCGAKPSSVNARSFSSMVWPRSEPATSAAYTGAGRRLRARAWATATDSNHGLGFHGFCATARSSHDRVDIASGFLGRHGRRGGRKTGQGALRTGRDGWGSEVRSPRQLQQDRCVAGGDSARVVLAGGGQRALTGERLLAVALDALRVRTVQRQAGEKLR